MPEHSFDTAFRKDPMRDPKGTLRQPPHPHRKPEPRTEPPTNPNEVATTRSMPAATIKRQEPPRRLSRGSTIAAWVMAFIVVLFILGTISNKVSPPSAPHPAPTVTVTVTPHGGHK